MATGMKTLTVWAGATALAALCSGAAVAETLSASYGIYLAGLPIGRANIGANIAGDRYKIDVAARMTGLVGAVTKGSGQATATGTVSARAPTSSGYALSSQSSDGPRTIRVAMAGGNVKAAEMNPPLDPRPDRVPVTEAHKHGVMDPVSALIMPAPSGPNGALDPAGCNRTLPIFDGATRFDVVLSYKEQRQVRSKTYSGPVLVCAARYVPQAGHRPARQAVKYMEDNRDMEAWLAPIGPKVLIPYRIAVQTQIGQALIEASDFTVQGTTGAIPARAAAR
ncbi:DUF3108 domain-containing protein [Terrarubrum flagellatum]|uniref:DUF3108 domain-containing protein n=1 Tax=Terrirubrum flagellatum TaxID=2895980 RepID=UPI003144F3B9